MVFELVGKTRRDAVISDCGRYRYRLRHTWNDERPPMVWVLLNPSTADADEDDPTVRRCVGFAKAHQFGGVTLVNLFAYRATNPKKLKTIADPIGPENDRHILRVCGERSVSKVIGAWGAARFADPRARQVEAMIRMHQPIWCFGKTVGGQPRHPLYVSYSRRLERL
jgi:hypothetical protein